MVEKKYIITDIDPQYFGGDYPIVGTYATITGESLIKVIDLADRLSKEFGTQFGVCKHSSDVSEKARTPLYITENHTK